MNLEWDAVSAASTISTRPEIHRRYKGCAVLLCKHTATEEAIAIFYMDSHLQYQLQEAFRFETITTDLSWNDSAICHAFRRKLTAKILDRVHQSRSVLPDTFVGFKQAAQQAENHIKIGKRTLEDREDAEYSRHKRFRFATDAEKPERPRSRRPGMPLEQTRQKRRTFIETAGRRDEKRRCACAIGPRDTGSNIVPRNH